MKNRRSSIARELHKRNRLLGLGILIAGAKSEQRSMWGPMGGYALANNGEEQIVRANCRSERNPSSASGLQVLLWSSAKCGARWVLWRNGRDGGRLARKDYEGSTISLQQ